MGDAPEILRKRVEHAGNCIKRAETLGLIHPLVSGSGSPGSGAASLVRLDSVSRAMAHLDEGWMREGRYDPKDYTSPECMGALIAVAAFEFSYRTYSLPDLNRLFCHYFGEAIQDMILPIYFASAVYPGLLVDAGTVAECKKVLSTLEAGNTAAECINMAGILPLRSGS